MKRILYKLLLEIYRLMVFLERSDIEASFRIKYEIDDSFRFNGEKIKFYGLGRIVCGKNSYIGSYSTIQSSENCKVEIGSNCLISHNVRMYTSGSITDWDYSNLPLPDFKGDIIIGDYVLIGANVFIVPGVKIGNNAIVGANSVVTKDIQDFEVFGGVPARLLKVKKCSTSINN